MAHLKYAVLSICQWYSPHICVKEVKFVPGKIDDTISAFTSAYYYCFSFRYASKLLVTTNVVITNTLDMQPVLPLDLVLIGAKMQYILSLYINHRTST